MKILILALALASFTGSASAAKKCVCTCVVKDDDGKYSTMTGQGADREAAGDNLKKALGKRKKCEITPDCTGGGCKLDAG